MIIQSNPRPLSYSVDPIARSVSACLKWTPPALLRFETVTAGRNMSLDLEGLHPQHFEFQRQPPRDSHVEIGLAMVENLISPPMLGKRGPSQANLGDP